MSERRVVPLQLKISAWWVVILFVASSFFVINYFEGETRAFLVLLHLIFGISAYRGLSIVADGCIHVYRSDDVHEWQYLPEGFWLLFPLRYTLVQKIRVDGQISVPVLVATSEGLSGTSVTYVFRCAIVPEKFSEFSNTLSKAGVPYGATASDWVAPFGGYVSRFAEESFGLSGVTLSQRADIQILRYQMSHGETYFLSKLSGIGLRLCSIDVTIEPVVVSS